MRFVCKLCRKEYAKPDYQCLCGNINSEDFYKVEDVEVEETMAAPERVPAPAEIVETISTNDVEFVETTTSTKEKEEEESKNEEVIEELEEMGDGDKVSPIENEKEEELDV